MLLPPQSLSPTGVLRGEYPSACPLCMLDYDTDCP